MFRNLKRCVPRLAQPSPFSHPHLMKEGELTIGVQFGEYVQRRDHFCSLFPPNSLIILPGACRARWTNDLYWPFRQESNFWYLTGFEEPNALAVFHTYSPLDTSQNVLIDPPKLPSRGSEKYTYYLICEEPNEHSDLWDGPRAGTNGACEVFGADKAISRNATGTFLNQLLEENRYTSIYYPSSKAIFAPETDQEVRKCLTKAGVRTLASPDAHFWTMRALKSSAVQTMMKRAAKITHAAFLSGMRSTRPGRNESHIAAAMDFTLQTLGAQRFAYVPVIASGDNALSLHYIRNDSLMRDNTMVMVDAGAEYHYYPTDCTRAWPVNGSFTKAQRILYNAVLEVQEDLLKRTVAGEHSLTLQRYSEDRLLEVLLRSEVIQRQRASTEEQQREVLKQIYPHAWGHFMGIDIHEQVTASSSVFQEGMMHTVEPGVYIPHNPKIAVNDAYRGIGFRIEDNVILGGLGLPSENITESIPKSIEEIEHLMKSDSPVINSVATALESVLTHF